MARHGRGNAALAFIVATSGGDWAVLRTALMLMPQAIMTALLCWLPTRRPFGRDEATGKSSAAR